MFNVYQLTSESVINDTTLLGWYSPSHGYSFAYHTRGEVEIAGIDAPEDSIPVYVNDLPDSGSFYLSSDPNIAVQEIASCMYNDFAPLNEVQDTIFIDNPNPRKIFPVRRFRIYSTDGYVSPPRAGSQLRTVGYGNWFLARTVPNAPSARAGAMWYLQNFQSLLTKVTALGVQHRQGINKSDNIKIASDFVSYFTLAFTGNYYAFAAQGATALELDEDVVKAIGIAGSISNLAGGSANNISGLASETVYNVGVDTITPTLVDVSASTFNLSSTVSAIHERVSMEEFTDFVDDLGGVDYAMAFPDFGNNFDYNVGFDYAFDGSIVDQGETFFPDYGFENSSAISYDEPFISPDVLVGESDFGALQGEIVYADGAAGEITTANEWVSGSDLETGGSIASNNSTGLSPSAIIQGGRQIYTAATSRSRPSSAGTSAQTQRTGGAVGDVTRTASDFMRSIGNAARDASYVAGQGQRIVQTVQNAARNINSQVRTTPNQRTNLSSRAGDVNSPLIIIGAIAAALTLM